LDEQDQRVYYKDAYLEFAGIPVLYTPYFSHPSPGADRKSGFLSPTISHESNLGLTLKTPYYYPIGNSMDFTVAPIFTTEQGEVLTGEFRHLVNNGQYNISGSLTQPEKTGLASQGDEFRGHLKGEGHFQPTDKIGWGYKGLISSDDTYLRAYKFSDDDLLFSKTYAEKIDKRNYLGGKALYIQSLRAGDDKDTIPYVLPSVDAHYETTPFKDYNSRLYTDGNILVLSRKKGAETRRASGTVGLNTPYVTSSGHVFSTQASLRGDAYNVSDVAIGTATKNSTEGRAVPEIMGGWRFPMINYLEDATLLFEPIAEIIASPSGNNPVLIPNEDSQEIELSDVNLFSSNRFTGLDRIEGGVRTNYGVRGSVGMRKLTVDYLAGQSYRNSDENIFTPQSGLDTRFSDYVGKVSLRDNKGRGELTYRFRMDQENYQLRRNEFDAAVNYNPLRFNVGYINLDEPAIAFDRNEIVGDVHFKVNDRWTLNTGGRRDLGNQKSWIDNHVGATYENSCFYLNLGIKRDYTRDRDIAPSTSYLFQVSFKNFGNITD
jgi:LPS-assembly protein